MRQKKLLCPEFSTFNPRKVPFNIVRVESVWRSGTPFSPFPSLLYEGLDFRDVPLLAFLKLNASLCDLANIRPKSAFLEARVFAFFRGFSIPNSGVFEGNTGSGLTFNFSLLQYLMSFYLEGRGGRMNLWEVVNCESSGDSLLVL